MLFLNFDLLEKKWNNNVLEVDDNNNLLSKRFSFTLGKEEIRYVSVQTENNNRLYSEGDYAKYIKINFQRLVRTFLFDNFMIYYSRCKSNAYASGIGTNILNLGVQYDKYRLSYYLDLFGTSSYNYTYSSAIGIDMDLHNGIQFSYNNVSIFISIKHTIEYIKYYNGIWKHKIFIPEGTLNVSFKSPMPHFKNIYNYSHQ